MHTSSQETMVLYGLNTIPRKAEEKEWNLKRSNKKLQQTESNAILMKIETCLSYMIYVEMG